MSTQDWEVERANRLLSELPVATLGPAPWWKQLLYRVRTQETAPLLRWVWDHVLIAMPVPAMLLSALWFHTSTGRTNGRHTPIQAISLALMWCAAVLSFIYLVYMVGDDYMKKWQRALIGVTGLTSLVFVVVYAIAMWGG